MCRNTWHQVVLVYLPYLKPVLAFKLQCQTENANCLVVTKGVRVVIVWSALYPSDLIRYDICTLAAGQDKAAILTLCFAKALQHDQINEIEQTNSTMRWTRHEVAQGWILLPVRSAWQSTNVKLQHSMFFIHKTWKSTTTLPWLAITNVHQVGCIKCCYGDVKYCMLRFHFTENTGISFLFPAGCCI